MSVISNFNSAIREGGDVDPGYYGSMMFTYAALIAFFVMGVGLSVQCWFDPAHKFDALTLGQGMGLVTISYAGALVAVGALRRLDRPASTPQSSSTLTRTDIKVGDAAAQAVNPFPPPAELTGMESAGRGAEPMPSTIGAEDVGKKPLLSPKKGNKS